MRVEFISEAKNNRKVILIFAGWGSDARLYDGLKIGGWDVVVVYEWVNIDHSLLDFLTTYHTIYLYAWSLGVYAAELLADKLKPTVAIAINGTYSPVNNKKGIPELIFKSTLENLTCRSYDKFQRRMFATAQEYNSVKPKLISNSHISNLKSQLEYIWLQRDGFGSQPKIEWTKAIISKDDAIFPAANQLNAWQDITQIQLIEGSHYLDIISVIRNSVVDIERVRIKFSKSSDTYSQNALVQRYVAQNITDNYIRPHGSKFKSILEIGAGQGLLTKAWAKNIRPEFGLYIDLCEMPLFDACDKEEFIIGDAEKVLDDLPENMKFDAIFSASTIQWFSNLPHFFNMCYCHLNNDGIIALSSFLPGNLPEIYGNDNTLLSYYSVDSLFSMLAGKFDDLKIESDSFKVEFDNPIEALRHLQLTGVTGVTQWPFSKVRKAIQNYKVDGNGKYTLTYLPVYIFGKKKQ